MFYFRLFISLVMFFLLLRGIIYVSIRNLVLYLKGFSKHYHFIISDYKVFLSSFNSVKSKGSLKLKRLNVPCYLKQGFYRITIESYEYKETP
jgi:hypothetical protein